MPLPDITANFRRPGALALTRRLLPPRAPAAGVLEFPSRALVPRRWEAVVPCLLDMALVAAAMAVLFPSAFAGWRSVWLGLVSPLVLQAAMIAGGMLRVMLGPWFPARLALGLGELAALAVAASAPGWPRAVAIIAVLLLALEGLCRLVSPSPPPPPES